MSITLNLFPTINSTLYGKIGFFADEYEFAYHKDQTEMQLETRTNDMLTPNSTTLQIYDENCVWYADSYDLLIRRCFTISNPLFLFGSKGIADEDSELGVALFWLSKTSNQRGAYKVGSFCRTEKSIAFDLEVAFLPGVLTGSIDLQTVIYLKKPSFISSSTGFAQDSGTILGVLDHFKIVIDGKGSVFPVVEVNEPSQPLWYVKCDWTDPLSDGFEEENVSLCINRANPNYESLRLESGLQGSPLLAEVIASGLQTIVQKIILSPEWDDISKGRNIEDGSIGQAVYYFISNFGWDTSSPERLALSIRKDFENRL